MANMISARDALERLRTGNKRFVEGSHGASALTTASRRQALVDGQMPFAIILGCADSRVPAEIVFDQGLGDLFVVRVAGNVVAPSQVGSVEFAAAVFGTPLVVVLGHSSCGAVSATIDEMRKPSEQQSPNLASIVNRIRPGIETLVRGAEALDGDALLERAVRANVHASVDGLKHGSAIIEDLVSRDELKIVGAEYSLATGHVEFFETRDNGG